MTFEKFMNKHEDEIMIADLYNANGEEINLDFDEIPPTTNVLGYTNESGWFDIELEL